MLKSLIESRCKFYMKKIITMLFAIFLFSTKATAASNCTYAEQMELNQKVANIKISYEISSRDEQFSDMTITHEYFQINILNLSEEFYIVVKNNLNEEEKTFTSADAVDGVITYDWDETDSITNFTMVVYTSEKTGCPSEKYKTFYLTTPRFNEFYNREKCQENGDFYLCQKYVTFSHVDENKFLEQLESFEKGKINNNGDDAEEPNLTFMDKVFNFIDKYKWYFIGVIIISIGGVVIYRIKTRKQRKSGL